MRSLLRPKVIISLVLSTAVLVALLAFADLGKVLGLLAHFRYGSLLAFGGLVLAYEVIRGTQWHLLLRALRVRVPLRAQALAFALGEMSKNVPVGTFLQNYVLEESRGTDMSVSSAATVFVLANEIGVSLLTVIIFGLGSWWWAREAAAVALGLAGLLGWLTWRSDDARLPPWLRRFERVRRFAAAVQRCRDAGESLLRPQVLLPNVLLGAAYVTVAGTALHVALRGLGVTNVAFTHTLAAYCFGLAASLLFPLPLDFGALEVSGMGALLAVGAEKSAAVAGMMVNRVLSIAVALLFAAAAAAIFRQELRRALHARAEQPDREPGRPPGRRSERPAQTGEAAAVRPREAAA